MIEPFKSIQEVTCKKCGSTSWKIKVSFCQEGHQLSLPEHLHLTCHMCSHTWVMRCKDA